MRQADGEVSAETETISPAKTSILSNAMLTGEDWTTRASAWRSSPSGSAPVTAASAPISWSLADRNDLPSIAIVPDGVQADLARQKPSAAMACPAFR